MIRVEVTAAQALECRTDENSAATANENTTLSARSAPVALPESLFVPLILVAERVAARTHAAYPAHPPRAPPALLSVAPAWTLMQHGSVFLKWSTAGAPPYFFWVQIGESIGVRTFFATSRSVGFTPSRTASRVPFARACIRTRRSVDYHCESKHQQASRPPTPTTEMANQGWCGAPQT